MRALRQVLGAVAALGLLGLAGCELFLPESSKECDQFCSTYFDVTCAKSPSWEHEVCPSFCTIDDDSKPFANLKKGGVCELTQALVTGNTVDFCKLTHSVCGDSTACANSATDAEFACRTKWLEVALYWKLQGGCSDQITKACAFVSGRKACTATADPATCK